MYYTFPIPDGTFIKNLCPKTSNNDKKEKMNCLIYVTLLFTLVISAAQCQDIKNTIITPHLNVPLNGADNIVYTSSFALAWKMLENNILNCKVSVNENIPLVDELNNAEPASVNDTCSVTLSGFVDDGIDRRIAEEMKRKFHKEVDLSPYTHDPSNIICYSFFHQTIRFSTPFETFPQPFPFYSGGRQFDVDCFGVWTVGNSEQHQGIRKLVKVIDFISPIDFILCLSNPGEEDELIMAICKPLDTFRETIEKVIQRIKNATPTDLVDNDRLVLPKVFIDAHKQYRELHGIHLANRNFQQYFFREAEHNILFRLDESGAFAEGEAKVVLIKGPGSRTMLINRPFLLLMKEKKTNQPYFAAWIANPELLIQSK